MTDPLCSLPKSWSVIAPDSYAWITIAAQPDVASATATQIRFVLEQEFLLFLDRGGFEHLFEEHRQADFFCL